MEQKKLKPWVGVVFFVLVVAVLYFVCFPIQYKIGLWGVGVTELILLAMAIIAPLFLKQNLKEVFPIRLPKIREIIGLLIFFLGGYVLAIAISATIAVLFPQEMQAVSSGLNSIMTSEGMWLGILIVSVMPAICEEAVHRGFILHTFKNVKSEWVVVIVMGLLFGVFHLDFYRFAPTAVLGGCMTWIMLKTKNMVMPSLYHAINNLFPVLIGFASKGLLEAAESMAGEQADAAATTVVIGDGVATLSAIGVYMMFLIVALPLLLAGTALMKKKGDKVKGKHVAIVFIVAGAAFIIGLGIVIGCSVSMVLSQGIGM